MKNVLTYKGVEELLKKKLAGRKLPDNWENDVKAYLDVKQRLSDSKADFSLLKNSELQYYFLKKEDSETLKLPYEIHPSGHLQEGFVIMPLKKNWFVYNYCGLKDVVKVQQNPDSKRYFIEIENNEIFIHGNPIREFLYELPDTERMKEWASNTHKHYNNQDIWDKVQRYFRLFLDLPEYAYNGVTLYVFQTWLKDLLNSSIYLAIIGAWGSGKTSILEVTGLISRSSVVGNVTAAVLRNEADKQRISIFIDELDSVTNNEDDCEKLSIIRTGQRRGQDYYKYDKDGNSQRYNTFGPKAFTIKTQVEGALLQRSFPITTVESTESTLPVINLKKWDYAIPLLNDIYGWYLDNILYIVDTVRCVYYNNIDIDNIKERGEILAADKMLMKSTESAGTRVGRNAELAANMGLLVEMMGVDLKADWYTEVFKIKGEIEEEHQEVGDLATLRDLLAKKYRELAPQPISEGWRTPEGFVKIAHKELYEIFQTKLRNDKLRGCSPKDFAGYLRELGFDAGNSKVKRRCRIHGESMGLDGWPNRLALLFMPHILGKLSVKEIEPRKEVKEEKV